MTTKIEVTVPQGADYYVRVETMNLSTAWKKTVHYIDPGNQRVFHIWSEEWVESIKEIKWDSGTRP